MGQSLPEDTHRIEISNHGDFQVKKISKKQRYKTTNIRYFLNMYSTRTSAKNSTIKQIYREYRSNLKFRLFT